ncbi:uncharacterized protein LOC118436055 [Folsomia candida]|nr:uncharacterized protein LOC118436055 [Folsomia candida]
MFYCSISSTSWKRIKALLFLMILIAEFISESGGVDVESFLLDKDEDDESDDRRVGGAHIFNKKTRRLLLRLFRRRIKIPEKSSLSLATQVSRPNIFPGLFNQEDGFITDAVVEVPLWLDLDDFAEAMYAINSTGHAKAAGFIGTER